MDIKSLLIPSEEYNKTRWPNSYKYKITTKDGGGLFYFGITHSSDPKNPLFIEIEKEFEQFKPDLVFVEGQRTLRTEGRNHHIEELRKLKKDTLIREYGESGFVARLGLDYGIHVDSPEPDFKDEINHHLKNSFTKDELFVYYMIRYIRQRFRVPEPRPTAEKLASYKSQRMPKDTGWEDFDFSLDHLNDISQKIWGNGFDINSDKLGRLIRPNWEKDKNYKPTRINQIAKASWRFRDEYIVGEIIKALRNHRRLFVVFGFSHAIVQEPALRQLLIS